ncbi:MAG: ABC transporter permease subunit [Christensenellales bacterium]
MPYFSDNGVLPKVFGIHIGWIIALVLVLIVHLLFKQSKLGYKIAVVGESETARYAGINPTGDADCNLIPAGSAAWPG